MESILHLDLVTIIQSIGYLGLFIIIFAESGLLIGIFLPGDSLLFTAGFLASQGFFNIYLLCIMLFFAAVSGDSVGYAFGHKVGRKLFRKEDSIFFHKKHLIRAENFYEKYGAKTITIARFLPIVRTFAPIVAGVGNMQYSKFLSFNILGAFLWAILIPLSGYFLGNLIPGVDKYLLPIILIIIIASIAPTAIHVLKEKEDRQQLVKILKRMLSRILPINI